MFSLIIDKLEKVLLPDLVDALKKSWTPELDAELKVLILKWLKGVTANTATPIDNIALEVLTKLLSK